MRFQVGFFALVGAFYFLVTATAHAAYPEFALGFSFKPPYTIGNTAPDFVLDVCADPACATLMATMQMSCKIQNIPSNNTSVIKQCAVRASERPRNPDPNFGLLSVAANLRLRMGNLTSPPFVFAGGQPNIPETVYRYYVSPGPTGFVVSPQ